MPNLSSVALPRDKGNEDLEMITVIYFIVAAASLGAGIIQSVTGFGAAIFLMLIVPALFNMVGAPALACAISMCLGISLAWSFRKHVDMKIVLLPTIVYILFSVPSIGLVKNMDLNLLTVIFGVFLILLAGYFFLFSSKIAFPANWKTATVCAAISGVASGFFGIGGPLMAIYFVSATKTKASYIGNIQFLFGLTNLINLLTRISNGIYTLDLVPFTLLGLVCILLGKRLGLRILDRIPADATKKLVYAFVGLSGILTVIQQVV